MNGSNGGQNPGPGITGVTGTQYCGCSTGTGAGASTGASTTGFGTSFIGTSFTSGSIFAGLGGSCGC
jgi:hypothetical protein